MGYSDNDKANKIIHILQCRCFQRNIRLKKLFKERWPESFHKCNLVYDVSERGEHFAYIGFDDSTETYYEINTGFPKMEKHSYDKILGRLEAAK